MDWKLDPSGGALAGSTRWPVRTTSAISPNIIHRAKEGTGAQEGRPKTFPNVRQSSLIVTGLGAVALTAPVASPFCSR